VGKNIIASLSRVADDNDYLLVVPEGVGYEETQRPHRRQEFFFERRSAFGQLFFEQVKLPALVRRFQPDLIWGLGNFGLVPSPSPQAILFHKPHFVYEARFQRRELPKYRMLNTILKHRLLRALPHTSLVFCQTSAAAGRFKHFMNYRGKIAVMPNAVSEATLRGNPHKRPALFEKLAGRKVLFCLTRYYPHKNLELLAEVFERYGDQLADVVILCTVEAHQHPLAAKFLARIGKSPLCNNIISVGVLQQKELSGYYHFSDALMLPSFLESFTGTYLEAMEYRKPILTSDMDFARVVCGEAASYFDPFSPVACRDAIRELIDSPTLQSSLIAAGIERRASFVRCWDDIVSEAVGHLYSLLD
jgi:glycosyltransferase involved in cell wall biosynthesis